MPNGQGSIDEVIGQQAIDQVAKFEAAMKKLTDQMTDTLSIANQLNSATGLKSVQAGVEAINTTTKATKNLTAAMALEVVERQHNNNALKTEAKERSSVVGAYTNLDAAQQKLAQDAKNLGIQFGINSQQFKDAAKSANEYLGRLRAVDEALGNSRRNVGNYQGAVFSMSQVIRELPAFTYSAQQGFLAMGNNFPILIDEITRMRKAGESLGSVFATLARSIFSFVNVFTILSALFTIFYKDIMQFVRGSNEAAESLKKIREGSLETEKSVFQLKETLRQAQEGIISKTTFLKTYNEVLGSTYGATNDYNEAENNTIKNAPIYLAMVQAKIKMNEAEALSIQKKDAAANVGVFGSGVKAMWASGVKNMKSQPNLMGSGIVNFFIGLLNPSARDEYQSAANREARLASQAALEAVEEYNKLVDALDGKTGGPKDKKTKDVNRITELKQQYENELNELKIHHAQNEETEIEFQAKVLKLNAEYATKKIDAVKNLSKDERETALDWKAQILEDTKKINDDIAADSLELFRKLAEDGGKSVEMEKKQLDEKKKAWDKAYDHYMSLIDKMEAEEDKARVAKLTAENKAREQAIKDSESYWDAYISAGQSSMDIISTIADAIFAKEMRAFDLKERRLKDFYDNERRFIEQSGFSASQKQKMQQKLDAETEAKRKQNDRDRITALRKQAAYDKAFNIAQITAETALAVVRALTDKTVPNFYLRLANSIAAGAAGSAQLARAIATPLPQYARGRKGGKQEWAVVGEAGQEAIVHNGRVELTPNQATVTLLPEGADVIPNHELIKNAAYVKLSKQGNVTTDKLQMALLNAFDREHEDNLRLQQILLDKKFSLTNKDLSGYEAYRLTKVK